MIIVNFKRYSEATGEKAIALAKICKKISDESGVSIIAAPTVDDLASCVATGAECWTQKFEPNAMDSKGTILNHSDFRLQIDTLKDEVYLSKSRGDKICICSADPNEVAQLLSLSPDYLGYEPPQLIGSKTSSVAEAQPEVIGNIAKVCKESGIPLLVGAGIKSAQDIKVSLQEGASGFLLASSVVLAADPEGELRKLAEAFKMN